MRIDVLSLFPDMFAPLLAGGITARACERGLLKLVIWNPRDYTQNTHRTVDDRPYGGGPGMVMCVQPLRAAVRAARTAEDRSAKTLYLSPQGRKFDQAAAQQLAQAERLILIAGRYEGVDERFIHMEIDEEWSIGDYVLSGGELAAMVMIDALVRLLPDVLGDAQSAQQDSFMSGLLDYPHYTRPALMEGLAVPSVLLSGDHEAIRRWRLQQSLGRTWLRRPDLLAQRRLDREQRALLDDFIREHHHTHTAN